jgi:flagellar M-ring protein FliF
MNPITQMLSNAWKNFNALAMAKKVSLVVVTAVTILGIMGVIYYTGQVDYRVLFSNLSSEDASSIISKLQEKKIPYQISTSGSTVSVPADKVAETRLELAASGLPQGGGVGFELFDKKMMGATEFEQQLNYRRALQGELSRTINSLDEIQSSRVHIVIPKESLFIEQQKKPTASVTVKLKSGRTLHQPQIEGIAHLVASSIEGLNADDVMVVDSQGNILSKNQSGSKLTNLSNSQVDYQRNVEKDLAAQIKSMLENVVGPSKAVVKVAADIDFRVTEKTEETFDPESAVVRSSQKQADKQMGTGAGAGTPQQEKTDELVNYEINKVVSKTVMPVGEIKKLSIAVMVDGTYTKDSKGVETFQPRDKKELDTLEDVVRKSAGFNATRGDQVVVTSMPFQRDTDAGFAGNWQEKVVSATATFSPLIKYAAIFAAIFLVFMFVIRPLVKSLLTASVYREPETGILPAGASAGTMAIPGETRTEGARSELRALTGEDKPANEADLVKQLAVADSKKFAELLRSWL